MVKWSEGPSAGVGRIRCTTPSAMKSAEPDAEDPEPHEDQPGARGGRGQKRQHPQDDEGGAYDLPRYRPLLESALDRLDLLPDLPGNGRHGV